MPLHVLGERFVSVDGVRTRYVVHGHGDPVLLLHGLPACILDWRALRGPLATRGRVLALDLPGFGLSGAVPDGDYGAPALARFVLRFLDVLGEERPALVVGHSNGGAIGQILAADRPERVRGLVLISSVGFALPAATIPLLRRPAVRAALAGVSQAAPRSLVRGLLRQVLRRNYVPGAAVDEHLAAAEAMLAMDGAADRIFRAAAAMDPELLQRRAPSIQAPTLIVHGTDDRIVPARTAENLRRAIPRARLVMLARGSHMIHVERAAEVAELLQRFDASESRGESRRGAAKY